MEMFQHIFYQTCWFAFSLRNYWSIFIHAFEKNLILPGEKFSLKGRNMRNLQAIWKNLLECKWLVVLPQAPLCTHPAFSNRTHLALLPSGAQLHVRKSEPFMFFGRSQLRSWRLLPSPMWITDNSRIQTSVTNASQAPERKTPQDEQTDKGKLRLMLRMVSAEPWKQACHNSASSRRMNKSTDLFRFHRKFIKYSV